jgi:hypothetical protein
MIDIPAETTISRYAIPARNLLMRCEASFPAPTPRERSAPGSFSTKSVGFAFHSMSALPKQPMLGVRPGSLCLAGRLRFKLPNWGLQTKRYELADYEWAAIKLPNKPRGSLIRSRSSAPTELRCVDRT